MSTYNDISKPELAMRSVVIDLGLPIYKGTDSNGNPYDEGYGTPFQNVGQDDSELKLPYVVCAMQGASGQEVVKNTGIWKSNVIVRVATHGSVPVSLHRLRAATVFDAFCNDDIKTTLSDAITDFFVYEVNHQSPEPARRDPIDANTFSWVSELQLEMVWCGSDIEEEEVIAP